MQNSHLLIIFILIFLTGNVVRGQQPWTLNQCISFAIENNLNLKAYEIQSKLSLEELNQSRRNRLPGISASSNAGISFGRSVDPNTNDYINTEFFNNSFSIGSSVTIFNGFRLQNQIKYQQFRKQISEYNKLNAIDDLAFQVMTSYFDVIYFEGMLKIAEEQLEASKLSLKTTEKQVEVGLKAKADLLEMRANLEKEELNRIQFENEKKTALLQLKQHLNFTGTVELAVTRKQEPEIAAITTNPQSLFSVYTSWSPYYKSIEAELFATEKGLALYRSQLYPSISASGSLGTNYAGTSKDADGNIISFGEQFTNNRRQYLGASLNIPIFSRWNNRSNIKKAKLNIDLAKNRLESEKQKMWFEVANNLNELEALNKEYKQYEKQKEADELAFKATTKKFKQGLINVVEFYIAKNRLANTESQVLRSKLQWEIKNKAIEFYKGNRFWENGKGLHAQ